MIVFLSVFPPFRGGISRFGDHVLSELKKHSSIRALNYKKQYPSLLFPGKTQLDLEIKDHESLRWVHPYNPFQWFRDLPKGDQKEPITHFIYTHWHPFFIPSTLALIKKIKKRNPNCTISGLIHNVLPHETFPFQYELVESLFTKSDRLFTLSTEGSQSVSIFSSHKHKTRQLFHPIYESTESNFTKNELRSKWEVPENATVLLFFGLIREYKGLSLLIEAFNKAADARPDLYLCIAGEFYEPQDYYEDQLRPELSDRVTILNKFLSKEEASEMFRLSDVLVLPYKKATQSGVLADAIAYGLPSIVTNQPGFTDYLIDGYNGIVLKTQESNELANELFRIDKKSLEKYRANTLSLQKKYNWETFGKDLFKLLQEI